MRYDTKIAVAVREDLAVWQKLNVTAFLSGGVAGGRPESVGEPYQDGSDRAYLPLFREPVMVFQADARTLARTLERARSRGLACALYTEELFKTGNDADNRAAVRAVPTEALTLAGVAVYGPRADVDKAVKGLRLHP